jgi:murein DD-endopeptidase MepM/ murein hydrolase activator NlpD
LDGGVVAFADNASPQDYGPVIVLEHEIDKVTKFYTLYGHLSHQSLKSLRVGQKIKQGKKFAELGSAEVNGGWTPHLHFQIMVDLLDWGRFPGAAQPSQRNVWLSPALTQI